MHRFLPPRRQALGRALVAAVALAAAVAAPAPAVADPGIPATTSIWGYSGLVLVPTAQVHGFRDFSVGAHLLSKAGDIRLAPYATAGVFEGLEFGVLYGVPMTNFSGLTGHAKYQLVKPTKDRPTAVAVGLSMIGINETDRWVDGNNVYLVLSQDFNAQFGGQTYTLFSGHFGFQGNLKLGARMMGGLEVPIADKGSLVADVLGPMGSAGGFFNLGATYRLTKEVQVRAFTMGVPGAEWTNRDYALGLSYSGNLLGNAAGVAEPGPSPTPSRRPSSAPTARPASPKPTTLPTPKALPSLPPVPVPSVSLEPSLPPIPTPMPSVEPDASPTPGPEAASPSPSTGMSSVRGSLLDDKGRPLPGWSVGVPALDKWVSTDDKGRYTIPLPLGPYELAVRDPQGRQQLTKTLRLVTSAGMELPLVVAIPVGELKGMVIDRQSKQGLGDADIRLFRQGETYNLSTRDSGAFYMGDLPSGNYRVVVTRSRYQPYEGSVSIVSRQERSLLVPLNPKPGTLSGRVTNLKGQGQPGVAVSIPVQKLSVATDRLGAYTFKELPPGDHEVIFQQGDRRVATTLVRVRADETTTENVTVTPEVVTPSKAGTIGGQVTDAGNKRPVAGVKIVVESGDLTVLTITASDGRFNVTDLPPGTYRVSASKTGFKTTSSSVKVTTKAGATVNMALTPAR